MNVTSEWSLGQLRRGEELLLDGRLGLGDAEPLDALRQSLQSHLGVAPAGLALLPRVPLFSLVQLEVVPVDVVAGVDVVVVLLVRAHAERLPGELDRPGAGFNTVVSDLLFDFQTYPKFLNCC